MNLLLDELTPTQKIIFYLFVAAMIVYDFIYFDLSAPFEILAILQFLFVIILLSMGKFFKNHDWPHIIYFLFAGVLFFILFSFLDLLRFFEF